MTAALAKTIADQERRYAWLLEFGERQRRAEEVRQALSEPRHNRREMIGARTRKIARILERDGDLCCYCQQPLGEDMTLEHRVASSNGGSEDLDNLKLAHALCNREVGNLPPDMKDELARRKLKGIEWDSVPMRSDGEK
jgi:5-methylcytosine-specific restriction endonuclease McrA